MFPLAILMGLAFGVGAPLRRWWIGVPIAAIALPVLLLLPISGPFPSGRDLALSALIGAANALAGAIIGLLLRSVVDRPCPRRRAERQQAA